VSVAVPMSLPPAMPRTGVQLTRDLSLMDAMATLGVFLVWLVYENVFFFYAGDFSPVFAVLTNGLKLLMPFALLLYAGLPPRLILLAGRSSLYLVFFAGFLAWALVPTLFLAAPLEWVKLLPRFVFFLAVLALFARRPATFSLFAKLLVLYVLSALLQYILLYVTGTYETKMELGGFYLGGPYGLFGNVTSMIYIPSAPFPFIRLAGFWNEPSNASASAFAAGFLARYLVAVGESRRWVLASRLCFISGILTLSNAGYFALGSAVLVGTLFSIRRLTGWRLLQLSLLLPMVLAVFLVVAFGRVYVANNMQDNIWARAAVGASDTEQANKDPTSGRLDLANTAIKSSADTFVGLGIQGVGPDGMIDVPAGAPLYWLYLTGIPGLLLLLGREAVVMSAGWRVARLNRVALPVVQALVAVMAQHTSYGSWMNPNYFVLAAMVLVCARTPAESS
jgi:hypothetical protein